MSLLNLMFPHLGHEYGQGLKINMLRFSKHNGLSYGVMARPPWNTKFPLFGQLERACHLALL